MIAGSRQGIPLLHQGEDRRDVSSRIATKVLQLILKQHFGSRSEVLVAFGIKPFRGLKRARKA
jgi:hypothetical protein